MVSTWTVRLGFTVDVSTAVGTSGAVVIAGACSGAAEVSTAGVSPACGLRASVRLHGFLGHSAHLVDRVRSETLDKRL